MTRPGGDPVGAAAPRDTPRAPVAADVTVVIPVRDRHAELARCLSGLRDLAHVIVVDDASADPLAIKRIAATGGAAVIHRPVNGGPGAARNTGLAAAQTELVAFLDSDCVPRPAGWPRLLPHFTDPAIGAVAPRIVPHEHGDGWLARYEGASSTLDMGARPSVVRPGARVPYVPGAALVVARPPPATGSGTACTWGRTSTSCGAWRRRAGGSATSPARSWATTTGSRSAPGSAAAPTTAPPPPPLSTAPRRGPPAVRLLVDGGRVGGGPCRPPSHRGRARRHRDGPARPPPVARHRRALARPCRTGATAAAWRLAARLAGGGTLAAARPLGSACRAPGGRSRSRRRSPCKAAAPLTPPDPLPPLLDWADRKPPLDPARYVAARLLDDAAYSLGVWQGCLARRTVRPLLPVIGGSRQPGSR